MLWIGGSSFFIPLLVPYSCVILEKENCISSVLCVSVAGVGRRMSSFPQFPTFLCLFFFSFSILNVDCFLMVFIYFMHMALKQWSQQFLKADSSQICQGNNRAFGARPLKAALRYDLFMQQHIIVPTANDTWNKQSQEVSTANTCHLHPQYLTDPSSQGN